MHIGTNLSLLLGCFVWAVFAANASASDPFFAVYAVKLRGEATPSQLELISASQSAGQFAIVMLVPVLVGHVGSNRLLKLVIGFQVILYAVMGAAHFVPTTIFVPYTATLKFLRGLAVGTFEVVMRHVLISVAPLTEVPRVVGWIGVSESIGTVIGPIAGAAIFTASGFVQAFMTSSMTFLLAFVVWSTLAMRSGSLESPSVSTVASPQATAALLPQGPLSVFKVLAHSWDLQLLLIVMPVLAATAASPVLPLWLAEPPFALSVDALGLLGSVRSMTGIATSAVNEQVFLWLGSARQALIALILQAAGFLLLGSVTLLPLQASTLTMIALAGNLLSSVGLTLTLAASWHLILKRLNAQELPTERCTVGVAALNQYAGTGAETFGMLVGTKLFASARITHTSLILAVPPFVSALILHVCVVWKSSKSCNKLNRQVLT